MKSQVMKKAWEIFKKVEVKTKEDWSQALRKAWAIVKGIESEAPKFSKEIEGFEMETNIWTKHGYDRLYFEGKFFEHNVVRNNHFKSRIDFKGYVNLKNGKIVELKTKARDEKIVREVLAVELTKVIKEIHENRIASGYYTEMEIQSIDLPTLYC